MCLDKERATLGWRTMLGWWRRNLLDLGIFRRLDQGCLLPSLLGFLRLQISVFACSGNDMCPTLSKNL